MLAAATDDGSSRPVSVGIAKIISVELGDADDLAGGEGDVIADEDLSRALRETVGDADVANRSGTAVEFKASDVLVVSIDGIGAEKPCFRIEKGIGDSVNHNVADGVGKEVK